MQVSDEAEYDMKYYAFKSRNHMITYDSYVRVSSSIWISNGALLVAFDVK